MYGGALFGNGLGWALWVKGYDMVIRAYTGRLQKNRDVELHHMYAIDTIDVSVVHTNEER